MCKIYEDTKYRKFWEAAYKYTVRITVSVGVFKNKHC